MPNVILAVTQHFLIEWWPGKDRSGLYIKARTGTYDPAILIRLSDGAIDGRSVPQFFVQRVFVPGLIVELRSKVGPLTLFSRVLHDGFIPGFHRRYKKDGGKPNQAYYTPLSVEDTHLKELADALETACSEENIRHLEAANTDEYYSVLDNDFLQDGVWASVRTSALLDQKDLHGKVVPPFAVPEIVYLPPSRLAEAPRERLHAPSHTALAHGSGFSYLRVANARHHCCRGASRQTRRSELCLHNAGINPGEHYLEYRRGQRVERFHLTCAFRSCVIPDNWLSPRFEQYHILMRQGLKGWVETERRKRTGYDDEALAIPTDSERVTEFVRLVQGGYQLDSGEREEWREHLRHVPIDCDPFLSARWLAGLTTP